MEVTGAGWLTWLAGSPGREKPVALFTDASGQRNTEDKHTPNRGPPGLALPSLLGNFHLKVKKGITMKAEPTRH